MKTYPAVSFRISPSPIWRWGVVALALLVILTMVVWAVSTMSLMGVHESQTQWVVVLSLLVLVLLRWAVRDAWFDPIDMLRWTGRGWMASAVAQAPADAQPGRLDLLIDGDSWMLLRWTPMAASGTARPKPAYLVIAAANIDLPWHTWRCALYGARPRGSTVLNSTIPMA